MNDFMQPDEDMRKQAISSLEYANSYLSTVKKNLQMPSRKFDNDLLYSMLTICFEKFFVGLLARYNWNAESHLPLRLYKEAQPFEPELTDSMKATAILLGSFESICSLDGFGYRTPTDEELHTMVEGLNDIQQLTGKRISELI